MTERRAIVVGAGGHGKVVCSVLRACGIEVLGFVDDDPALEGHEILGLPILGQPEILSQTQIDGVMLGIGNNCAREKLFRRIEDWGIPLLTAVHPSAVVAESVRLSRGVVVMPLAILNPCCHIGDDVIINSGAIVEHDSFVDSHAHIGPGACLCGGVRVGARTLIGARATVIPYRSVGEDCTVAAGAVVTQDAGNRVLLAGMPATVKRTLP